MSKDAQLAAVQEQEVVLRNRVAQLTETIERMQEEQIAKLAAEVERLQREVRAAQAAQRTAEEVARVSPWAMLTQSNGENWQLAVLVFALAVLLASLILQRRGLVSRHLIRGERPLMATRQAAFDVETCTDADILSDGSATLPPDGARQPRNAPAAHPLDVGSHSGLHDRDFERDLNDPSGFPLRLRTT